MIWLQHCSVPLRHCRIGVGGGVIVEAVATGADALMVVIDVAVTLTGGLVLPAPV